MSRSEKARYGAGGKAWKDTVFASRSQARARAKRKRRRSQQDRARAKALADAEARLGEPRMVRRMGDFGVEVVEKTKDGA